jgi:hypothetical protein
MKPYIDTDVVSAYTVLPPSTTSAQKRREATRAFFDLAKKMRVRLYTSSFMREEALKGAAAPVRRREIALRKITVLPETEPIRKRAAELCVFLPKELQKPLGADARHYVAACAAGTSHLVTWNLDDFIALEMAAMNLPFKRQPIILDPEEILNHFGPTPVRNPPLRISEGSLGRPDAWLRRIIETNRRAGTAICQKDGFFDLVKKARRGK